jgi:hypothetical protein
MAETEDRGSENRDPSGPNRPTGGGPAYREGPNPDPGGSIEPGGLVPPYEGRTTGRGESADSQARLEGVAQQLAGAKPGVAGQTASPAHEHPVQPDEVAHGSAGSGDQSATDTKATSPKGVGVSTTQRGEDIKDADGEVGRDDTGPQGKSQRPSGTSTPRDMTSIDPG